MPRRPPAREGAGASGPGRAPGGPARVPGGPGGPGGPGPQGGPRFAGGAPRHGDGTPAQGVPRFPDGTPAQGIPRFPDGTPAQGFPRLPDGTPAGGVPRYADGTPAHGVPGVPGGGPSQGGPRYGAGTPAHGVPGGPGGAPPQGGPRFPEGTPAHGVPQVRGGHPEQREAGGGWGRVGAVSARGGAPAAANAAEAPPAPAARRSRGPRQEYLDAFGENREHGENRGDLDDATPARPRPATAPGTPGTRDTEDVLGAGRRSGGKGRTFTGAAAAAVTTVLAVVVAGQVTEGRDGASARAQSAGDRGRDIRGAGGAEAATPPVTPSAKPLTYAQKMAKVYPLTVEAKGSGDFAAVPGTDKAPGRGRTYTYRVDVEKGLGLDAGLFAEAAQKTLNDDRSWAHDGALAFKRVSSGKADFVLTLASSGTTAKWCAKSGLDTTEDNVSCDSAATERVMINAYRWAQGSKTYGDDHIYAYRQMLINHEVGHRLGRGHVNCDEDGALAPVMQQQTKFLDHDGIHCLANPWPYPKG
ncbi:DUF3152 domain-containing protein [Streptomyces sp. C1-2]|uniref:DUF3152 domain-containing protein n=1 Tax=Streptomyces sp. C1-2 TaxID=2720022 RepID=UPI003211F22C